MSCGLPFGPLFDVENPTPWQEDLEDVRRKLPREHATRSKIMVLELLLKWRNILHAIFEKHFTDFCDVRKKTIR